MDRLTQLVSGTGGKQSRAGFLAACGKASLVAAAIVSGLSLSVASATANCCGSPACSAGDPNCPGNSPPTGWAFQTSCTCCPSGPCGTKNTNCNVFKNPNADSYCYTYTQGNGTCPCRHDTHR